MRVPDSTVPVRAAIRRALHELALETASCLPRRFHRLAAIVLIGNLMIAVVPIHVSAQSLHWWVADMLEGIRESADEDGSVLAHAPLTGALDAGESASIQVHTCSGILYTAVGICDFGCNDLDLTAYDSSGDVLDSDVRSDQFPVLAFTAAESGITTLSVEMVSCTDSCDWGVQLFIEDGMVPAPLDAGDGGASTWSANWDRYVGIYRGPSGDTTVLRHNNRLVVLFPLARQQVVATGVLQPTGTTHVFVLESDGSSVDRDRMRFVVNDAGQATAVFVARDESRRVG